MATQVRISLQEYLAASWRPDREYIDGEVRERNVGKWEHARLQWLLANWFAGHETEWGCMGATEQRLQIRAGRVRIPDLLLVEAAPQPDVLTSPPLLVIEILSPDDSFSDLEERIRDYRELGVATIWTIDPKTRTGRMCVGDDWKSARRLEVSGSPIFVDLDNLFSYLNQPRP